MERRTAILNAARGLAVRDGVRNVSLGDIAGEVGLAKSNVVRYFGTREEIYLELTAEELRAFELEIRARLEHTSGLEGVVEAIVDTLAGRPLFCDLISECTTTLERNVSLDVARSFKLGTIGATAGLGAAIARAHPLLTESEGAELAGAAALLAGLLYQMATPAPVLQQLYAQEPAIAAARLPFVATLKRTLLAMATGLPALRESAPS